LIRELGDYHDELDPDVILADRMHAAARRNRAPEEPQNDAPANDSPLQDGSLGDGSLDDGSLADGATNSGPAEDGSTNVGPTNNASPGESFAPPPGRNSDHIAPPQHANHETANDLQQPCGAKFAE